MSHTKEPWRVSSTPGTYKASIWNEQGQMIADLGKTKSISLTGARENARRIVACVNACAGIGTEVLEGGGQGSILALGLEEQKRGDVAERQRDDLLDELLRVKEICLRECGIGIVNENVIASAKGGSA